MGPAVTKNSTGEECVICEQHKVSGIHVNTAFLCEECERELIAAQTSDERYVYYLKKLRKIKNPGIYS